MIRSTLVLRAAVTALFFATMTLSLAGCGDDDDSTSDDDDDAAADDDDGPACSPLDDALNKCPDNANVTPCTSQSACAPDPTSLETNCGAANSCGICKTGECEILWQGGAPTTDESGLITVNYDIAASVEPKLNKDSTGAPYCFTRFTAIHTASADGSAVDCKTLEAGGLTSGKLNVLSIADATSAADCTPLQFVTTVSVRAPVGLPVFVLGEMLKTSAATGASDEIVSRGCVGPLTLANGTDSPPNNGITFK